MNLKKSDWLLISAFLILIGMIVAMSVIGGLITQNMNSRFNALKVSYSEWIFAEQANSNLISVHRAMKDVALARTPEQLETALRDVAKYDRLVKQNFSDILRINTNHNLIDEVVRTYDNWEPIRTKVIQLAENGQSDLAAEITQTEDASQLALVITKMNELILGEKAGAVIAFQEFNQLSEVSQQWLMWLTILLLSIMVSLFWVVIRKIHKYEAQLYDEKEELQITLDSIGDGVIVTDLKRNVLRLNRVAEAYTGWLPTDAVGWPFSQVFNIISAISDEKTKDPVEEVLLTGEICQMENHIILVAKDGTQRHIAASAAPIRDREGSMAGVVMIFRDVTEGKKLEEKLRISEEHYRMLFNSMLNGYALHEMICDDLGTPCDYRFVDVNPAFEELTGLKKCDCIGKTIKELMPAIEHYWIEAYGKVVLTGEPIEFEDYAAVLGEYYHVFAFRPLENHFAVIVANITERRQMETSIREREERFHYLFENMASGAAIYEVVNSGESGIDYIVKDLNKAGINMEGKNKKEEVIGKKLAELQPRIDECGLIPIFQNVWQSGQPAYHSAKICFDEDRCCWYDNHVFRLASGEIVAIYDDVTEKKVLNEKLKKSEEQYRLLVEHQNDLIVKIDLEGRYLYVSPSYCQLFGKTETELLGNSFLPFVHEDDISVSVQALSAIMQPPYRCSYEERVKTVHGWRWIEWAGKGVLNEKGEITAMVDTGRDITERKKNQEEILYLNYHDVLTGLYNRKFFEEEIKRIDTEQQLPISVIWGDINGLKLINDGFGHSQGDKILMEIAKILTQCCREEDIIARIGGDEFCILLPQTSNTKVKEICRCVQAACEKCRQETEHEIFCPSISLGYGTKTMVSESMESVLKNAEAFMYRCKLLESKSMYSSIISSIRTTMDEKNHETGVHAERLVLLSRAMGKQLNLSEEQLNELALLATLHDIGKMSVDDRVLNKPDKLSRDEWMEMKKHPEVGYRIAMASQELVPIAGYILSHHEHWDGSGYPQGMKGREIPLLARILAIVDAYDAMTQNRPYRKAMTREAAIAEIKKHAGSQFDPELVKVFLEI